jgi:hypothetical protein
MTGADESRRTAPAASVAFVARTAVCTAQGKPLAPLAPPDPGPALDDVGQAPPDVGAAGAGAGIGAVGLSGAGAGSGAWTGAGAIAWGAASARAAEEPTFTGALRGRL